MKRLCWDHRVTASGEAYRLVRGADCDHGPHEDRPLGELADYEA